jgi:hypothetical protein
MPRKNPRGIRRYPHPGKYEGGLIIDTYVDSGSYDEDIGESDTTGFYGLLRGISVDEIWKEAKADGEELTKEEVEFLESQAGAIIYEDSQGFITVSYYDDESELNESWNQIVDEISEALEEEE